ncbi:MAG: FHA domain-containing protein, partial [Candidatus Zixiibacteriota bacterium]
MTETETKTRLRLVGTDGAHFFAFDLAPGRYILGRRDECDLCVPDRTVSRKHAEIEVAPDNHCFVTDLGSHNGTTLNGAPVTTRVELKPGQKISFGQVEFTLKANGDGSQTTMQPSVARLATAEPEKSVF